MSDIERLTDAELVAAYLAGDSDAFADIYDRYSGRIFSYHLTMLRDRQQAADASHDTFMRAAANMVRLDDPDELRPWLFAIARSLAHGRGRGAETKPDKDVGEARIEDADPRDVVLAAADELGERDQQLLVLHLTEGLEGDHLARAMGVESSHIPVMVARLNARVEKVLGEPLRANLGVDDQTELQGLLPAIVVVPAPAALRARVLDKVDKGVFAVSPAPAPEPRDTPEWMKLAVFGAVTLLVGLIGFAVSAQFEPLDPPPTVPVTEPPPAEGGSTTTSLARSSTTRPGGGSTTTNATQTENPAAFEVSTDSVDFGDEGEAAQFDISNTGGQRGQWDLQASSDAISLSSAQGELAGGETITIDLSLDREAIEEGELSETVSLSWADGQVEVAIVGTNEANPIIHDPQADPSSVDVSGNPECENTQTTVSARVRDASPLESVVVRWSPDGGSEQETEMTAVGNDMYEAVIGPFTAVQSTSVRVVAFDERGNAGGAATQVTVVPCP